MPDADLLIVGAGIAGASAAWYASRAGLRTLIIDAGAHRASDVPTALINPVRGLAGRVPKHAPAGARHTFDLISRLQAHGHAIPHGRGVWRPVPDASVQAAWSAQFPPDLMHRWHPGAPPFLNLRGHWHATLECPESGWVDGPALVRALLADSGAERITATVTALDIPGHGVTLDKGDQLAARELLWCAGAWGAHTMGFEAVYRPGSVIATKSRSSEHAIAHGLYAAPHGPTSVLGPTHEPATNIWPDATTPPAALPTLIERARGIFEQPIEIATIWRGVRLGRVTTPPGLKALGPYGARGFLMAPMEAADFIEHGGKRCADALGRHASPDVPPARD